MVEAHTVPPEIDGYTVLPLALPILPSFPVAATHYLYLAPHQPKQFVASASRSLFLVNIPFDATDSHFRYLFSTQLSLPDGRIEKIELGDAARKAQAPHGQKSPQDPRSKKSKKVSGASDYEHVLEHSSLPSTWDRELHGGAASAVIIFVDRASMEAALKAAKAVSARSSGFPKWDHDPNTSVPPLGIARYQKHQELTFPDKTKVLESVNEYMTAFAAKEAEDRKLRTRMRQEPDEDGFVTVTRGGRSQPASQASAKAVANKHQEKRREPENFYRFQGRERRKAQANELKRKFEEDRDRVRQMREKRSFKPE